MRPEVSLEAHGGGQAEPTIQGATDLCREAERQTAHVRDQDALDQQAVLQTNDKLLGAIRRFQHVVAMETRDLGKESEFRALVPGQISHLVNFTRPLAVEPPQDLLRSMCRPAKVLDKGFGSLNTECEQIDARGRSRHLDL